MANLLKEYMDEVRGVEEIDCKNGKQYIDFNRHDEKRLNAWQIDQIVSFHVFDRACLFFAFISILCAHFSYFDYTFIMWLVLYKNATTS